jgi:hypothetical protein
VWMMVSPHCTCATCNPPAPTQPAQNGKTTVHVHDLRNASHVWGDVTGGTLHTTCHPQQGLAVSVDRVQANSRRIGSTNPAPCWLARPQTWQWGRWVRAATAWRCERSCCGGEA